jgi:hypothetical protein
LILRDGLIKVGLPEGAWYQIHRAFNLLALVCVTAGFAIAVSIFNEEGEPHFSASKHTKIGFVIFVMMFIQVGFAFIKPSLTHAPKEAPASDVEKDGLKEAPESDDEKTETEQREDTTKASSGR